MVQVKVRRYSIDRITGLPPKKDGAASMWKKPSELPRLIALRHAVLDSFQGDPPLSKNISISLCVHVGVMNSRTVGDLDNFITGICDGLQACHPGTPIVDRWLESDCELIHPNHAIGLCDDSEVVSIRATKVVGDDTQWYSLELSGE